jgi:hypothetical protein
MLERSVASVAAFRAAHPDKRICDVHYADLVRDPLGTVRSVYAAFGDELSGQALGAMTQHVESHPKGKFGRHAYDLAEFGLDAGAIRDRFRHYVERYGIPLEQSANG